MLSAADICPITFEPFTESGPMQPRVLPVCGHTFSRVSLEQLLRLKENWLPVFQDGNRNIVGVSPLRCPLCAQPQKKGRVRSVEDCPPNWQLIYKLREVRNEKKEHCSDRKKGTCYPHPRPCSASLKVSSQGFWDSKNVPRPRAQTSVGGIRSSATHARSTQTV